MSFTVRRGTHAGAEPADIRWLSEAEQLAWRGWIDASRRVLAATDRQLKRDAGLTTDDYEVFVRLSEAEGHRLRMSDLASSVTNSPSRLSQRVDRLSRDGYVGHSSACTVSRVCARQLVCRAARCRRNNY